MSQESTLNQNGKNSPITCTSWYFFDTEGNEVGRLEWDNGTLSAIGNLDETAYRLFEKLKDQIDEYVKEQKKRGPYKKRSDNGD